MMPASNPTTRAQPRRGDIWLADINGDKIRPVVIMTRTAVIVHLHSLIVGPVTSTIRNIPTEVRLGLDEGLLHDSVANFDNTQLLPKRWLIRKIGQLGPTKLDAACYSLNQATGCSTPTNTA
jgi:mRNA interferase MazF